jgi:CubicO group peptidase (beta-lactamase class C family)
VAGGLLRLDEPIGRLFDTAAARSFYGGMTLRDLLSHSAGLPREQVTPVRMYGDPGASLAHYVERDLPQRGQGAAEGWGYSNAGFAVIAHALERAAGTPFPDLMQQVVFDPLNMRRTTFDHATAVTFPVAAAHVDDDEGDIEVLRPAPRNEALYPAAFLFSTATDLVRLGNLHLGFFESAEDLLPETLRREMRKPHRETFDEELPAYGLGFYTEFPKTRQFGHVGGIGGYGARLDIDASSGAVGAVLFNRMPEEGWPEANLLRFVDQALEK